VLANAFLGGSSWEIPIFFTLGDVGWKIPIFFFFLATPAEKFQFFSLSQRHRLETFWFSAGDDCDFFQDVLEKIS
jgi:hypothetical protein